MRNKTKYRLTLAIAVVLALGLVAQGVLLWQTRQQVAALDSSNPAAQQSQESENLSDVEQRLLSRLDEQDKQRSQQFSQDPFFGPLGSFGPAFADPFAQFESMRQRMNSLMGNSFSGGSSFTFSSATPDIELEETDDDYRLLIKVPEEQEIALQTDVEDNEVTVSGKISAQSDRSGQGFSGQFISSSQFTRRFDLPGAVDDLKMRTEQNKDGLLIILPKKDPGSVS